MLARLQNAAAKLPYALPVPWSAEALATATGREAAEWENFAAGTHPLLHADVAALLGAFLDVKRERGSTIERALYASMTPPQLLTRMLARRPLVFYTGADYWKLRSGATGGGGFDAVGTDAEAPPLTLDAVQSYDEMALSALVGVATPTHFCNRGGRRNLGEPAPPGTFERTGVYYGLVGARFERANLMEWKHLVVTPSQNTAANGYGAECNATAGGDGGGSAAALLDAWARHAYRVDHFPSWAEAKAAPAGAFIDFGEGLLNVALYKRRMRLSIEPFLLDADRLAADAGKRAYVHIVGLGLGVWMVHGVQARLMLEVYDELLHEHALPHTACLDFSWFPPECTAVGDVAHGGTAARLPGQDIAVRFSKRDPAEPLRGPDLLLAAMYAWDGGSYPGNEYWLGQLDASGDPAAAACSTIGLLQNPDVNPDGLAGGNAVVWSSSGQHASLI